MQKRHVLWVTVDPETLHKERKISMIKCIRRLTGLGLKESKEMVDEGCFDFRTLSRREVHALAYAIFDSYEGKEFVFLFSDAAKTRFSIEEMDKWIDPKVYLAEHGGFSWVEIVGEEVEKEDDKLIVDALMNLVNEMHKRLN